MRTRRKGERGSAIVETLFSMLLLFMILFGILQLFQLALADMIADYAAFRGARSASVGFRERIAEREALIKSVPASGALVYPDYSAYGDYQFVDSEKELLKNYQQSRQNVQYAYWSGKELYHTNYLCPYYGEPMTGTCSNCCHSTRVDITMRPGDNTVSDEVFFEFKFRKYPLNIPLYDWFTDQDSDNDSENSHPLNIPTHDGHTKQTTVNISGQSRLTDYSSAFLQ